MTQATRAQSILEKLRYYIPGGVNSPARACQGTGIDPLIIDCAERDLLYDVEGKSFIDYCCSWGALIHGHAHPVVIGAANDQLERGSSYGFSTAIEAELAKKVCELVPSIEKVRFVSSGTEATMSAVRLARGATGRKLVIKFEGNYHGHSDQFLVKAGSGVALLSEASSSGVTEASVAETLCLPYNDVEAFQKALQDPDVADNLACVIVEPIAGNMGVVPASQEFLKCLRAATEKVGALLIFDEVISGFRVAKGGAQELYGIIPDLTCLGKIVGGGFPAAAFGGRADLMDQMAPQGSIYQAGTLSGNPVAMATGLKALQLLENPGFYEELERKTNLITEPLNEAIQQGKINASLQQMGSMFSLFFGLKKVESMSDAEKQDQDRFYMLYRALLEEGIAIPPSPFEAWFVSSAHTDEHLQRTSDMILQFCS